MNDGIARYVPDVNRAILSGNYWGKMGALWMTRNLLKTSKRPEDRHDAIVLFETAVYSAFTSALASLRDGYVFAALQAASVFFPVWAMVKRYKMQYEYFTTSMRTRAVVEKLSADALEVRAARLYVFSRLPLIGGVPYLHAAGFYGEQTLEHTQHEPPGEHTRALAYGTLARVYLRLEGPGSAKAHEYLAGAAFLAMRIKDVNQRVRVLGTCGELTALVLGHRTKAVWYFNQAAGVEGADTDTLLKIRSLRTSVLD